MKKVWFILLVLLLCNNIFHLEGFAGMSHKICYYPVLGYMAYYVFARKGGDMPATFGRMLGTMMLFATLSAIPCYLLFGQTILESLKANIPYVYAMVAYWFLLKYRPTEAQVLKALLIVSVATLVLQLGQQLIPQHAIFGTRESEYADVQIEVRNGIYRFRIGDGGVFAFPILFLAWVMVLRKVRLKPILTLVMMLVSIYLTLTRQVIVATLLSMFMGVILFKLRASKLVLGFMVTAVVVMLALNFDAFFGAFFEQSTNEINDDNYIRFLSAEYFFNESLSSPLVFIFGHGRNSGSSPYDQFIKSLADMGFYTSDVGLIGAAYVHGYVYMIMFYVIVYYVLVRHRHVIPPYLKMSVLAMTIYSIMIFSILSQSGVIAWAILLYLCELHIRKSPLRMTTTRIADRT